MKALVTVVYDKKDKTSSFPGRWSSVPPVVEIAEGVGEAELRESVRVILTKSAYYQIVSHTVTMLP